MPVMTGHRPDLAMPPLRLGQRMRGDQGPSGLSGRLRLPALRRLSPLRFGLPPAPGAFGHVDQSTEPRDRHARHHTDHFEALEGPRRSSALLLPYPDLNRSLTQPLSQLNSATSTSSCCSRDVDLPASIPALPPSRNCRFQFPIACPETFSQQTASTIEISP